MILRRYLMPAGASSSSFAASSEHSQDTRETQVI